MMNFLRGAGLGLAFTLALSVAGCVNQTENTTPVNTATTTNTTTTTTSAPAPSPSPSATPQPTASQAQQASAAPLTLPVLDAFFADESFAPALKSKLQLTDEQIEKLRAIAHEETARLRETNAEQQESGTTTAARARANEQIKAIIGEEKTQQLGALVRERWSGGVEDNAGNNGPSGANASASPGSNATNVGGPKVTNSKALNAVPADTRVVVNAPAYRMDVFENGKLVKTYKVGIGYPEFPLPTGLRKASDIIFNPTWTPPDSPWVATMKNVKAGEKIEAGSKLNPLGPIKIPIGMPSLIHGGKSPAKIGGFASHGCVGLTNQQVRDFARLLGQIGGAQLTEADIANYAKNKTETKDVKLAHAVPVELRYETIVVEDGKLHIYRDVYDRDTNTEENLRAVLSQYGVTLDQLSEQERAQALQAIKDMSHDAGGSSSSASNNSQGKNGANKTEARGGHVTRTVKGKKEVVIEIAALKGKGYPAPVNAGQGGATQKPATPAPPRTGKRT